MVYSSFSARIQGALFRSIILARNNIIRGKNIEQTNRPNHLTLKENSANVLVYYR